MEALEAARRERQAEGIHYPEVRIEEVWESFIKASREKKWLQGDGNTGQAIVEHECRVNPCWPMPHLDEILRRIKDCDIALGIVSNAQFYTPLLFPALLQKELPQYGFDESICVWSYREREGKPSRQLYRKLKDALSRQGIEPSETLYVGNDVRNDIWPAQLEGFRTVLFAGDQRSLRRREDDPDCRKVRPEFIITDLAQLLEVIAE
jgi:putative hydrolase of the HAD superfamily